MLYGIGVLAAIKAIFYFNSVFSQNGPESGTRFEDFIDFNAEDISKAWKWQVESEDDVEFSYIFHSENEDGTVLPPASVNFFF